MIDFIVFGIYIVTVSVLIYLLVRLRLSNNAILAKFVQSELDKNLIAMQLSQALEKNALYEITESDGFVKFLSTSRDWAFEYIEEVQKALAEFDEEVGAQLEWANTYGNLAGPTVHSNTIKIVSEAYDKLKTVLPKNTETPNN
jgi:hypothetical protein